MNLDLDVELEEDADIQMIWHEMEDSELMFKMVKQ